MDNKKQISFEGKGTAVIEYQKCTEQLLDLTRGLLQKVRRTTEDARAFLLRQGWINEKDELLPLVPQKVTITDGDTFFRDADIQGAESIELNGGELGANLNAKQIVIRGGNHANFAITGEDVFISGKFSSGVIHANTLTAKDTTITAPVIVSRNAEFHSSSNLNALCVGGHLKNTGTTVINAGADVGSMSNLDEVRVNGGHVRGSMTNEDKVEVHGVTVDCSMSNHNKSKVFGVTVKGNVFNYDSTEIHGVKVGGTMHSYDKTTIHGVEARHLYLQDDVQLLGPVAGYIHGMDGNVQISPKARFGGEAISSLPFQQAQALNWYFGRDIRTGGGMRV